MLMLGAIVESKKPDPDNKLPTMVTQRHPNLLVKALTKGPRKIFVFTYDFLYFINNIIFL